MSVWVCVPSARPVAEVLAWMSRWKERGYQVALWRDQGDGLCGRAHHYLAGPYPGYAVATNALIADVLRNDPSCDWVVATGDDTDPDGAHKADEIARDCTDNFYDTFGVMQPTGDRWGDDAAARAMWPDAPAMIDRIAGSPWIGREFARRINQGRGPLWPEYFHNWADQELQEVATKLGVFWQRRDLIHYHNHCMREPGGTWAPHLVGADADYKRMQPVFNARQKAGFPGSEPIA